MIEEANGEGIVGHGPQISDEVVIPLDKALLSFFQKAALLIKKQKGLCVSKHKL